MKNQKSFLIKFLSLSCLILVLNTLNANVASDYVFSSYHGTYNTIDGTPGVNQITTLTSGSWDDGGAGMFPIGFNFMYGGTTYNNFCVGTNGILRFDYDASYLGDFTPPTGPYSIYVFATDLYGSPVSVGSRIASKLLYKSEGTAPNRILTVEWKNFSRCCTMFNADISFQVKLYETSNKIEFVYGPFTPVNHTSMIGLSGNDLYDPMDIHFRKSISDWNYTTRTITSDFFTDSIHTIPDSGLVYVWDQDSNATYYYLNGRLFYDLNNNCLQDSNEAGVPNHPVKLNPYNYITYTDANGNYQFVLDSSGNYSIIPIITDTTLSILCPGLDSIYVHLDSTINNINIPIYPDVFCPSLVINCYQGEKHPCNLNYTQINFSNIGLDTARNVEIKVKLTPEFTIISSIPPWTRIDSNVYVYSLGDLNPLYHGSIYFYDSVSCTAIIGQTSCVKAIITATNLCSFIDTLWDSSSISLASRCDSSGSADSIVFTIMNKTLHNMTDTSTYKIYEDDLLVLNSRFILNANAELVIKVPATGKTFRLEADQVPHHPGTSMPREFVELCGPSPFSLHQILPIPFDDIDPWIDIYCSEILNPLFSYDPNLKSSSPAGIGLDHKIGRDLTLEYMIQFQNTGTGPASRVIVIDTIDTSKLQINTINMLMSSHAYRLDILDSRVLRWTFDPIYLPDSGLDEVASHGFVKFTMMPVNGLPNMTRINNYADIYFDYNSPVRTNIHYVSIVDEPNTMPLALNVNEILHDNKCYNQNIANADIIITRGTGHHNILWNDGNTSISRTNLPAGIYRYTITDWIGFTYSDSIIVTNPTDFNIIDSVQNKVCNTINNGSIILNISGATPTYTYRWNDGVHIKDRTGLDAGTYSIVITDANGCKDSNSFVITEPTDFSILDTINDIKCYNQNLGSISLNVSGATPSYSYLWADGSTNKDRDLLAAGTYILTITDANHCEHIESFNLIQPSDFSITDVIDHIKCYNGNDGNIDITVSGATPTYSYIWNDVSGVEDRSNLIAGSYHLTITDANGCEKILDYTITQPDELLISETHHDASTYGNNDGSIDLLINGGTSPYTYTWSNGETTEDINLLSSNTYVISVEDANGCISTKTIIISEPSGIISDALKNQIQVFPNPSSRFIQINTNEIKISDISMFDAEGKIVFKKNKLVDSKIFIPVDQLSNGVYILSLSHENEKIDYKITISH